MADGVPVYLDESLRRFAEVYPAAGTASSAVRLTVAELEGCAQNFAGWVDIGKAWREGKPDPAPPQTAAPQTAAP